MGSRLAACCGKSFWFSWGLSFFRVFFLQPMQIAEWSIMSAGDMWTRLYDPAVEACISLEV
jgi:hypothetical protein